MPGPSDPLGADRAASARGSRYAARGHRGTEAHVDSRSNMTGRTPRSGNRDQRSDAQNEGWGALPGWSGPPELLARIASAGIEAIHASEGHEPRCAIEVVIPVTGVPSSFGSFNRDDVVNSDVERFTSPKEFTEEVTADALRKFTEIKIGSSREGCPRRRRDSPRSRPESSAYRRGGPQTPAH